MFELTSQMVFNVVIVVAAAVAGLLVNILRESIKNLHSQIERLSNDIQSHKVEVATDHVKRHELESLGLRLFAKLDQMQKEQREDIKNLANKIDAKADK